MMSEPEPNSPTEAVSLPETPALMGLFTLCWRLDELFAQGQVGEGLGRLECYLLMQLEQPCRMGELAKRILMVPSTVTSVAQRLEKEGLAQRVRDGADRRAFCLQLTEKGHVLRRALEQRAGRAFREMSGLTAEEVQKFARLTSKIQDKVLGPAEQRAAKEN